MCTKLIYLVSIVLVLGLLGTASAELVGQWKLDEGDGTTAVDGSGNDNNGTLEDDPTVVNGKFGQALAFDNSRVSIPASDSLAANLFQGTFTLIAWINPSRTGNTWQQIFRSIREEGNSNDTLFINNDGRLSWRGRVGGGWAGGMCETSPYVVPANQWTHVAVTGDETNFRLYVNGELLQESVFQTTDGDNAIYYIGGDPTTSGQSYTGMVDDLRVYNHVLSESEIRSSMKNQGDAIIKAYEPSPRDGTLLEDTWISLSWRASDLAVSHDVYIGDNFDAVNEGAEDTFVGNQADTFLVIGFPGFPYPDGLVPGTTYYWRIDEVNEAEPNSPWKGDIWSFWIPSKAAYFPDFVNGAESVDPYDTELSWTPGFGAKLHTVYFGEIFEEVLNATDGIPQGTTTYNPGPLELGKTYYWRVDEFDAIDTHKGDVWSFTTKGTATQPRPANGAMHVEVTPILSWLPGIGASHQIYFGTDQEAVINANTSSPAYKGSGTLGSEIYEPGQLEFDTTYYWRVVEVDNANPDSPWIGPIWNFTTGSFIIVEDFESYNDDDNLIFDSWIDGFDDPTNGSLVQYIELQNVREGFQSMPFEYDNSAAARSVATLTLRTVRDWTQQGVETLSLWFKGDPSNAADELYVALDGSAIVSHDNPAAVQSSVWTKWNIDLTSFADQGVNLTNVNSISVGTRANHLMSPGDVTLLSNLAANGNGDGLLFFDAIELERSGSGTYFTLWGRVWNILDGIPIPGATVNIEDKDGNSIGSDTTRNSDKHKGKYNVNFSLTDPNLNKKYPITVSENEFNVNHPNVRMYDYVVHRDFVLMPKDTDPCYPVYYFESSESKYFYTLDKYISNQAESLPERYDLLSDPDNWTYQGISFCGIDPTNEPKVAVYRFSQPTNSIPAYAIDINDLTEGGPWSPWPSTDDEAFYVYSPKEEQPPDTIAVYRVWSDDFGCYAYINEIDESKFTDNGWIINKEEDLAWYAINRP